MAAGLAATLSRARAAWRPALLPAAALAAVLVANLSQMSRGETERIWLPFVPWLALAAPGTAAGGWRPRWRWPSSSRPPSTRPGRRQP